MGIKKADLKPALIVLKYSEKARVFCNKSDEKVMFLNRPMWLSFLEIDLQIHLFFEVV